MFYQIKKSKLYHNIYYFIADFVPILLGCAFVFGVSLVGLF